MVKHSSVDRTVQYLLHCKTHYLAAYICKQFPCVHVSCEYRWLCLNISYVESREQEWEKQSNIHVYSKTGGTNTNKNPATVANSSKQKTGLVYLLPFPLWSSLLLLLLITNYHHHHSLHQFIYFCSVCRLTHRNMSKNRSLQTEREKDIRKKSSAANPLIEYEIENMK